MAWRWEAYQGFPRVISVIGGVLDVILHDGDVRCSRSDMVMDSLSWDEEMHPGMLELFSMDNVSHGISSSRDDDCMSP